MDQKQPVTEKDWWDMFQKLGSALNGIQGELGELRKMKGTVEHLSSHFNEHWKKQVDNKIQVLEMCDSEKDYQIKVLTNVVIRQEEKIKELETKVTAAFKREIRPHVIVFGITEEKSENYTVLLGKIQSFFSEPMEIENEISVYDAYRRGKKGTRDRPVCVKLQHLSDKALIFSHASNLKDKKNSREKFYMIRDDQDDKEVEVRSYYRDLQNKNRDLEWADRKMLKIDRGEIKINNRKLHKRIQNPSSTDVLHMGQRQIQEVLAIQQVEGGGTHRREL